MHSYDFTLLTDHRYLEPQPRNEYVLNIFTEDHLLTQALENKGFRVYRTHWDDPEMDWSKTRFAVFRTTWDYFDRIEAFKIWMDRVKNQTSFINSLEIVLWNLDKHYLNELKNKGISIPKTKFIEAGDKRCLQEIVEPLGWYGYVIKPAISGAARHTHRFTLSETTELEELFKQLIETESMLIQQYLPSITEKGEVSMMVFGGKFSHAVLKKAKPGDFRVQDDFGGTVHFYAPSDHEIEFAEDTVKCCVPMPLYARVDVVWDLEDNLCVSELELIEPELWMRNFPESAKRFASVLQDYAGNKKMQPD